jgi:hypothetical protein
VHYLISIGCPIFMEDLFPNPSSDTPVEHGQAGVDGGSNRRARLFNQSADVVEERIFPVWSGITSGGCLRHTRPPLSNYNSSFPSPFFSAGLSVRIFPGSAATAFYEQNTEPMACPIYCEGVMIYLEIPVIETIWGNVLAVNEQIACP